MMTRKGLNGVLFALTVVAVLTLGLLISVPTYAQVAGATLSGTVTDPSGAGIPNAHLSIKDTATGVTRDITTNSAGFYTAPNLTPSTYDVTTSAQGFSTQVATGITLTVGAQQTLNIPMQVGQVTQQVQVTGEAAAVQLASSSVSATVNSTTVRELPLNGRDWTSLAVLEPGVLGIRSQLGTTGTVNRGNRGFGNQLATGGHRPQENSYRINGIDVNDYSNGAPGSVEGKQLGVDAIQEFSVLTTNYSAEYGRTSGAVINAILRSGTNTFHGSAYWFLRNKNLDARNFFDTTLPPFHRNQFGASAGGPIRKDKTFIFGDFEAIRQDKSLSNFNSVPSMAARNGLLCSQPSGSSCTPTQLQPNPADPNGTNAQGIDLLSAKYLALYPLPDPSLGFSSNGDVGHLETSPLQTYSENYVTTRIDHKISDKDSLDGFWFYDKSPQNTPDPFVLSITETLSFREMFGLEETHTFSATAVNAVRLGYNRSIGLVGQPGAALQPIAADTSLGVGLGRAAPIIQIQGIPGLEQGGVGAQTLFDHLQNSYQAYDDAFLTRGLHSIKFGGSFERLQGNGHNEMRPNGTFLFSNLENFLTNNPKSIVAIGNPLIGHEIGTRMSLYGMYIQDDWRFRPNLTLNIGLRYEPASLPSEVHNDFSVIQNVYGGPRVTVAHLWQSNPTLHNFAPRVGFAWDPSHNGKTAVRGGFGIFDVIPGTWIPEDQETGSYPFAFALSGPIPQYSFPFVGANLIGANATAASVTAADIAKAQAYAPDQHPKDNYAMNWNFNIQRELTPSLTAMIGYVGNHTVHLPFTTDQSNMVLPVTPGGGLWQCGPTFIDGICQPGSGTVVDPNVGALRPTFWMVSSTYNGLEAQITKKMSHGVQVEGSYTWGKCLDSSSSGDIGDPFQNSFTTTMFFLNSSRRGLCDFDIRQNLVINYIWELPTPKSHGLVAEKVLGGWQLGGILTTSSGIATTPFIGGDPLGLVNNDAQDYPNRLPGCNPVNPNWRSNVKATSFFNSSCFSVPIAPASLASDPTKCTPFATSAGVPIPGSCTELFGNAGRNSVIGPGSFDFDFSLFKNVPIHRISESFNVQFRAEFFNVFNHANFLLPNFNEGNNQIFDGSQVKGTPYLNASAVPSIIDSTGTYDPRQIQMSLKIVW
jgi:Carboxypeptidase regulatory-like domain/TonB dependent receptor-like, beta-barrel